MHRKCLIWRRHQIRVTDPLCGDFTGPVNSPHKGQWRGALTFSLISAWINGWANIRNAGDLRRHHAHYDVTVMTHPHCVEFPFDGRLSPQGSHNPFVWHLPLHDSRDWRWIARGSRMGRRTSSLQWQHNGRDGVSNHRRPDCLLNCLFRRRSKKTPKLRVTGLC